MKSKAYGRNMKGVQTFEDLQARNARLVEAYKADKSVVRAAKAAGVSHQHALDVLRIRGLVAQKGRAL